MPRSLLRAIFLRFSTGAQGDIVLRERGSCKSPKDGGIK